MYIGWYVPIVTGRRDRVDDRLQAVRAVGDPVAGDYFVVF